MGTTTNVVGGSTTLIAPPLNMIGVEQTLVPRKRERMGVGG